MKEQIMEKSMNRARSIRFQNVKIVLFGAMALCLLALTVLELISSYTAKIEVAQRFRVSSALISVGKEEYICSLDGALLNPTDERMHIDRIEITVSDRSTRETVTLEDVDLYPRFEREITQTWISAAPYEQIDRISITVDGKTDILVNTERAAALSGVTVFYLVLLLVDAVLLIRACLIRYYLHQEEQAESGALNG